MTFALVTLHMSYDLGTLFTHVTCAMGGSSPYDMWHVDQMHELSSHTKMLSQFRLSINSVSVMAPSSLGV